MYLKSLELVNTGPIEKLKIDCGFNADGSPKPIMFVGQNGSGKSLAIAHIVNALLEAQSAVFIDSDIEKGKVFKLRSPSYIRNGSDHSTGNITFSNDFNVNEIQLSKDKNQYQAPLPVYPEWGKIGDREHSHFITNENKVKDALQVSMNEETHLFFPPNRFEEPAWLNEKSLLNKASYTSIRNFKGHSNRSVVKYSPLRELQDWLLDLIYDSFAIERKTIIYPSTNPDTKQIDFKEIIQADGPATKILSCLQEIIRNIFNIHGQIIWLVGVRNNRSIGFSDDGEIVTSNLFSLSMGETIVLGLFLTIIRDFDLSRSSLTSLSDIKGIVIIDEIDLHLHSDLQHDLLPKLIKLFPNVQFIITTHSPLFLIGMEKEVTETGIEIYELPNSERISAERFSEFETAYNYMKDSAKFQDDIRDSIASVQKPLLYVEGTTDKDYISKGAEVLDREALLKQFIIKDGDGAPNLDKLWNAYKSANLSETPKHNIIFLYDCDVKKSDQEKGKILRRVIPQQDHMINSGIENLFKDETLERAMKHKKAFVDIKYPSTYTDRGIDKETKETWSINSDEKRNLCNWLCENGTSEDFEKFSVVFDILEEILKADC